MLRPIKVLTEDSVLGPRLQPGDLIKVLIEDSVLGPRLELSLQLDPCLTDDLIKVLVVIVPSTVRV